MTSELVQAWRMGAEANRFLLDHVPRGALADRYGARTRTVGQQFAHVHNVRVRWVEFSARALAVPGFPRGAEPTKAELRKALKASEAMVVRYIERCEERGKVPSWNGPPATFVGYLIAHEAHHRGLAMVAMRAAGRKLPREAVYGQWDWGKRQSLR